MHPPWARQSQASWVPLQPTQAKVQMDNVLPDSVDQNLATNYELHNANDHTSWNEIVFRIFLRPQIFIDALQMDSSIIFFKKSRKNIINWQNNQSLDMLLRRRKIYLKHEWIENTRGNQLQSHFIHKCIKIF